jgi:chemotaxis protein methyltransferase CheR
MIGWDSGPRMSAEEFRLLREMFEERFGLFFREETKYLLERRLAPRLEVHGLGGFGEYYFFLRHGAGRYGELDTAVELLTTNETYFYREPHQLRAFSDEILPLLARDRARQGRLRVWSAGCSTGEEPYTIAILLLRAALFPGWELEVLGTDLSRRVLDAARRGVYGPGAFRAPESEQLRAWFRRQGGKWAVGADVGRLVRFAHLNLLDGGGVAAVGKFDVVFCRNVLIYFDLPARRQVLAGLRKQLRPGGYLLLGHSESLLQVTADFELVHLRHDLVYRRPAAEEPWP